MKEEWKDIYYEYNGEIIDYRGLYQVSNFGRVKALNFMNTEKEQFLRRRKDKKGYNNVLLYKDDTGNWFMVHRLVAFMFLSDTYFDGAEVDHIIPVRNGGTDNVNNLHWVTHLQNMNNEVTKKVNLRKEPLELSEETKEKMKEVYQYRLEHMRYYCYDRFDIDMNYIDMGIGNEYEKMGFDTLMIFLCANRNIEEYKGYKWRKHADGSYKGRKF